MQQLPYYPFITRGGPVKRKLTYDAVVYTEDGHYFAEDNNGHIFCQDSPTACIQEAVNYVLSKSTGGKVYIRAGDYYLSPLNTQICSYDYICATIPYNAALIIEGDGDATRIHLPQNNLNQQAWLFGLDWNGTAPYTRKSKLRNIAFINDVNTGSYAMNVLITSASTNDSSGLEVDGVSVYDIQGTALNFTFWINNLYDVTFSRYRFFSVNSNNPNVAILFDSTTLGKIVDSFMYSVNGGSSAISNGNGSILVDSVEIYGPWSYAFNFGNTDGESHIDVTNSIIGINRAGSQGIQGLNNVVYGPRDLINNSGNGTVRFTITSSQLLTPISYNANNSYAPAYIVARGNFTNVNCINYAIAVGNPGTGQIYIDISSNVLGMSYGSGSCGGLFIAGIGGNTYLRIKDNLILDNGTQSIWSGGIGTSATIEVEGNEIYILGTNNGYSARNQFIWFSGSSSGGLLKFINNTVTWTATPSSLTVFYLAYTTNSSGTYYMPNIIMKGNTFNFPTSNATFGGFVGSAGATTANPNALFVDLDNTFNLSGINLPYPSTTTPAVPSSGTAQSNTYPYPVEVYVSGGSATAVQVTRGGSTYTVWSSSTATAIPPLLVRLEPGDSITLTYSTAPSWVWLPARFIS